MNVNRERIGLLTLATLGASAASPKRVLILNPFGRDIAPFNAAVSAFRATLTRDLGERLDIREIARNAILSAFAEHMTG